jgi:hypothetical protein
VIEVALGIIYVGLREAEHHCNVVEGRRRRDNSWIFGISGGY